MSKFIGVFIEDGPRKHTQLNQGDIEPEFGRYLVDLQHPPLQDYFSNKVGRYLTFGLEALGTRDRKSKAYSAEKVRRFMHFVWRLRKTSASPRIGCVSFVANTEDPIWLDRTYDVPIEKSIPLFEVNQLVNVSEDIAQRLDLAVGLKTEIILRQEQSVFGKIESYDKQSQLIKIETDGIKEIYMGQVQSVKLPID